MKRSTDRILVSHAGALPRPDDLRDLLIAKESGKGYDEDAICAAFHEAIFLSLRRRPVCFAQTSKRANQQRRARGRALCSFACLSFVLALRVVAVGEAGADQGPDPSAINSVSLAPIYKRSRVCVAGRTALA